MRTVKRKTDLKLKAVDACSGYFGLSTNYVFEGKHIENMESLEVYEDVQVPENVTEFMQLNKLNTKQLVKWLNENYKK